MQMFHVVQHIAYPRSIKVHIHIVFHIRSEREHKHFTHFDISCRRKRRLQCIIYCLICEGIKYA